MEPLHGGLIFGGEVVYSPQSGTIGLYQIMYLCPDISEECGLKTLVLKPVLFAILAAQQEDLHLFLIFIGQPISAVQDRLRERGDRDLSRVSRKGADLMFLFSSFGPTIKCRESLMHALNAACLRAVTFGRHF